MPTSLEVALSDERRFFDLVDSRAAQIAEYLREAADREAGGTKSSLRFENRPDHRNCRKVISLFPEPWWGVVVYSCFDSVDGTEVVAPAFAEPLSTSVAEQALRGLNARIQGHRSMVGRARSRQSLISACAKADAESRINQTNETQARSTPRIILSSSLALALQVSGKFPLGRTRTGSRYCFGTVTPG